MSDLQQKFDELVKKQEELTRQFQTEARAIFKETFKLFFEKSPGVKAVIWTQYTPYFNDGEECVFSVNDPTFTNATGDDVHEVNYGEYEGDNEGVWAAELYLLTGNTEWARNIQASVEKAGGGVDTKACRQLAEMIQSSTMEDLMKTMFGNHVKVIATEEGFSVDDYDHD